MLNGFTEWAVVGSLDGLMYPDAYRVHALVGVAPPSRLGDVMIYGAGHVGHREGLAVYTEERVISFYGAGHVGHREGLPCTPKSGSSV